MTWFLQLTGRLQAFFRERSFDRDFDEELESHLEMLTQEHRAQGLTSEQARRAAQVELGGLPQLREAHRDVRGFPGLASLMQDLAYAFRTLRKTPAFTAAALAALSLGIGATTAVFSLVNAILLKPMAIPDPDRFVMLMNTIATPAGEGSISTASAAKFAHWRTQTSVLEDISAFKTGVMNYTGGDVAEQLRSVEISAGFLHSIGVSIIRGRGFTVEEDLPQGPHVTLISEDLWHRRFAGDPRVLGKTISLSGDSYTVIGVAADAPAWREWGHSPEVLLPFQLDPNTRDQGHYFNVTARLKPGVSLKQAQARLQASAGDYRVKFPGILGPKDGFSVVPFREVMVAGPRQVLLILFGAVTLVLLIACANVANLLLLRATARRREIAIRSAIGAGRGRMVRQLLTESVLLSVTGGALGLLLGFGGIRALLAVSTAGLPRVGADGTFVGMDWRVMLFALSVSLATGVLFGIFPALQTSPADLSAVLQSQGGRSGTGRRQSKARAALVVSEVGLAVILLVGSALLIRSFIALYSVNPGFNTHGVLILRMSLVGPQFETSMGVENTLRTGLERIRALPGVLAASATCCAPLQGGYALPFNIIGRSPAAGPSTGGGGWTSVSPGFFDVLQIPVKRGRVFTDADDDKSPPVMVINETMAKEFWPDGDPLKDRVAIGKGVNRAYNDEPVRQVIGIVGDIHQGGLNRDPGPIMYVPQAQLADAVTARNVRMSPMAWMVRTSPEPNSMAPAIRGPLRQSTGLPVSAVQSMDQVVSLSTALQRFNMLLMTVFGSVALLLATIGIYGLMAYSVEQRIQEVGIRMALGAGASQVMQTVVVRGVGLALAGVTVGVAGAWGLSRFLASLLFGVQARDPMVFILVPILLSAVALLAVWVPAIRASRIDPIEALRYE